MNLNLRTTTTLLASLIIVVLLFVVGWRNNKLSNDLDPEQDKSSNPATVLFVPTLKPQSFGVYPPPLRMIWTFWLSGANMSTHRIRNLAMMRKNVGVPVVLITDDDLPRYNISWDPIHRFVFSDPPIMSAVHRGDYLRAYFMRHYGGGYHDIKGQRHDWNKYFDEFDKPENQQLWMLGTDQSSPNDIACGEDYAARLGMKPADCNLVRKRHWDMLSNGLYILRPGTPLAVEWLGLVTERIKSKEAALIANPVPAQFAGRCCGAAEKAHLLKYPLRWAELHGEALQPLQLRWHGHVRYGIKPYEFGEYQ